MDRTLMIAMADGGAALVMSVALLVSAPSEGRLNPEIGDTPGVSPEAELKWTERLARDFGLARPGRYWAGVIRISHVEHRGPNAKVTVLDVAEIAPGEVVLRRIDGRGDFERGWKIETDRSWRSPREFEDLSRPVIAALTAASDLAITRKQPGSLIACPHVQWIAIEVESRSHLPLSVAREASCHEKDPVPPLAAKLIASWSALEGIAVTPERK